MDLVHDHLATGKKLRVLTVVDTFSRYGPVLDPRHSYRGEDVVQTLERACRKVRNSIRASDFEHRRVVRQDLSLPLVDEFFIWLAAQAARVSRKSDLGKTWPIC